MGTLSKLAAAIAVVLSAAPGRAAGQGNPSRPFTRIRFARGGHAKVVSGRVGGESIDTWLLRVRKGQRVQLEVLRGLAELQQPEFAALRRTSRSRWAGVARASGDLRFELMAKSPRVSRYRFRVTVR